jgi:hypothetical protein
MAAKEHWTDYQLDGELMHRYIVTSAYKVIGGDKLEYLGSHTSKASANWQASRIHDAGGRALIHDQTTGIIIRDTGKRLGQVWGWPSRKGEKSPGWEEAR